MASTSVPSLSSVHDTVAGGPERAETNEGPSPKRARCCAASASDENADSQLAFPAAVEQQPPPPKPLPRCEIQFAPRCNHRHTLTRHPREAGAASDEPLVCDGGCGKEIPPSDPRWSCYPCDFDLCELCLLARSGGAVYLGLLTTQEEKASALAVELAAEKQRRKSAEERLARREREEKAAEVKASAAAEKRAADARVAEADERARAAQAEVTRLEAEVLERRLRSKANLEKMYNAQKESRQVREQAAAEQAALEERVAERAAVERAERESLEDQLTTARRHLSVAHGDREALGALSLVEAEQLEERTRAGLVAIGERRAALASEAAEERQKRLDCAVCLVGVRSSAFVPCGHIVTCKDCTSKVDECPLCKSRISSRVCVYLP